MIRHLAKLLAIVAGAFAGWQVRVQVSDVFPDPVWLSWSIGAGVLLLVYVVLYFPLLRPIFDLIEDRVSATGQRFKSTRTGVGLDEVPHRMDEDTMTRIKVCGYCGGPGGPVCERCHEKLSSGKS